MKKAKTNRSLIIFLNAILGVVFAFIAGFTYAGQAITFDYGSTPKSANAYLAHQQYTLVNDTQANPIAYSVGVHSVNVALQYSIDYSFDLRIKYSVVWTDGTTETPATNVNLIFANRDNVIVDEEYIYYIAYNKDTLKPQGLPSGEGKINLIAAIEIVDTADAESYTGKAVKVKIANSDIKIKKEATTSNYTSSHSLYVANSKACEAWLLHKNNSELGAQAHIMVYNYRYNAANGAEYPGYDTAYGRTIDANNSVSTATWLGGNRAFAGVGLYIVTGSVPITLQTSVIGVWRSSDNMDVPEDENIGYVFENNIRFNYTSNWDLVSYDSDNLFETRNYKYSIPANTACYVEILDSVEITSAGYLQGQNYTDFSLVVKELFVNSIKFADSKIQSAKISTASFTKDNVRPTETFTLINTSKYSNHLYQYHMTTTSQQTFDTASLTLINNTNERKQYSFSSDVAYHISNGKAKLAKDDGTKAANYSDPAYFRYEGTLNSTVIAETILVLGPYSSVELETTYSVGSSFQGSVLANYGASDAWVQLLPTVNEQTLSQTTMNLPMEVSVNGNTVTVSVVNDSDVVVKGINATLSIYKEAFSVSTTAQDKTQVPQDWKVYWWKYYLDPNGNTQNKQENFDTGAGVNYYYGDTSVTLQTIPSTGVATDITLTLNTANNIATYTNSTIELYPNDKITLHSFEITDTNGLFFKTKASASVQKDLKVEAGELKLISASTDLSYIINYSNKPYFVRFERSSEDAILNVKDDTDGYSYYMEVVQPGQIVLLPTASSISVKEAPVGEASYVSGASGTLAGWASTIIADFDKYFS